MEGLLTNQEHMTGRYVGRSASACNTLDCPSITHTVSDRGCLQKHTHISLLYFHHHHQSSVIRQSCTAKNKSGKKHLCCIVSFLWFVVVLLFYGKYQYLSVNILNQCLLKCLTFLLWPVQVKSALFLYFLWIIFRSLKRYICSVIRRSTSFNRLWFTV